MTVGGWLKQAEQQLKASGIETARLDARVLLEYVTGRDRSWLLAHPEHNLDSNILRSLRMKFKRRLQREPLAYILGRKEFYGLDFDVTPDVLIPRPETEALVEAALKLAPKQGKVLEIGTGSGCVAVALKHQRSDLSLTATDISRPALKIARANARKHSAAIKFVLSDLFAGVDGQYDLILANLPYVPTGARRQPELDCEPQIALYAGQDGLDYYRRFIKQLPDYLTDGGQAAIEAGPTQRAELKELAKAASLGFSSYSEYASILK